MFVPIAKESILIAARKSDEMLEQYEWKRSRTVLRQERASNRPDLADLFVKGGHERQFVYEVHTACDSHGFVIETMITPGSVHNSVTFNEVYDKVTEAFPEADFFVADSAYKTPHICRKVFDDGMVLSTAYKHPQTMKGNHEW